MEIKQTKIELFLFTFCYVSNFFVLIILSLYSSQPAIELFKFIQIIAFIIVCLFFLKKINKLIAFIFSNIIYFFYLILITFLILTQTKLSFSFLSRNIQVINSILFYYTWLIILLLIISIINSKAFYNFQKKINKQKIYLILCLIIVIPWWLPSKYNNELFYFINNIYKKDNIINYYEENTRQQLIQTLIQNKANIITQAQNIDTKNLPSYLDNIIILQLESLNSFLINEQNTPNWLAIAKQGILFPKFYSNSVETIFGQEALLCSLPVSFYSNLSTSKEDKKIICLPEIFKHLKYKTFFFKTYNLNFAKTGLFMKNLQFDEVHADDIMKEKDPKYLWGYREDIFFERMFDFFKKNKQPNKNFLFIEIGPTNHWPFLTPSNLKNKVPYKLPKKHQEKLINTTFLQDKYLKIALTKINDVFPNKNYTLFILSDHGWPAEIHKNNVFNKKNSFEENFLSSMIVIFGNHHQTKNKIINTKYSQMDLIPSIMDLFKIDYPANNFSSSFVSEINDKTINNSTMILIQPFSDKYLNLIKENLKHQYNATSQKILLYNLTKDPLEKNPQTIGDNQPTNLKIIKELLN